MACSQIQVLSVQVANKIAAGEVVDRPAAVLKELAENAIDAGATQIDVEIVAGGRKLVAVSDNGRGMSRDDALLSIERHATSKIRDVDDIERIATMGFRGEALAAIASVSRYGLKTCSDGDEAGTELTITGGQIRDVREIGFPRGSRVEVRDLFFNVPARRKFLRTHQTELARSREAFLVLALANPSIGMRLSVDGRETYLLPPNSSLEDRLRDLFGPDYRHNLLAVEHEERDVHVGGYVSLPSMTRGDRNEQFVFINRRPSSAALLGYAVREGYHTLLESRRHPSVFLFLTMDPGLVDVNVHPTKKEVRFRRPNDVRDTVIAAIRGALETDDRIGPIVPKVSAPNPAAAPLAEEQLLRIDHLPPTRAFRYPRIPLAQTPPLDTMTSAAPSPADNLDSASPRETPGMPLPEAAVDAPWSWCRVLGQIGGLYVILETEEGLVLMDPHAAHERVLFDKFMAELSAGKVASQGLLVPQTIELRPADAERVRSNIKHLSSMGFGISEFGGDSFVVDALPVCFGGGSAEGILTDVADSLERAGTRGGDETWYAQSIAMAACKSAVKAQDHLTLEEIEQLVVDLAGTTLPYTCPHGRPTLILTGYRELNRKFGRE